jgi:hypothetical protein
MDFYISEVFVIEEICNDSSSEVVVVLEVLKEEKT